ncbi:hypothetical protein NQD34_013372, partial [Periophthalmus magnuspinnatus]
FLSWFIMYLILLPVFLFVLYIGFTKWTTSQSSASGGLSHSDVFTLNMVAMELISVAGSCVTCYGFLSLNEGVAGFGGDTVIATMTGQMLFHSLTCVERYLAVVHPVIYLRLRKGGGVTIRNICIIFVWAFSVTYTLLYRVLNNYLFFVMAGLVLHFALLPLVAYCSVYVLCVLIRPKPGEQGGRKKQMDHSKRSTVYTMVAILGILLLRLITNLTNNSLLLHPHPWISDVCVILLSSVWPALPSSLV